MCNVLCCPACCVIDGQLLRGRRRWGAERVESRFREPTSTATVTDCSCNDWSATNTPQIRGWSLLCVCVLSLQASQLLVAVLTFSRCFQLRSRLTRLKFGIPCVPTEDFPEAGSQAWLSFLSCYRPRATYATRDWGPMPDRQQDRPGKRGLLSEAVAASAGGGWLQSAASV